MNNYITKSTFSGLSDNLLQNIIPVDFHITIDYKNLILRIFKDSNTVNYSELLEKFCATESATSQAFIKQVVLTDYTLKSFKENTIINTRFVWRLVFETIKFFRKDNPISGIGSQGFLSIELYRFELNKERKILRLHLWDEKYIKRFDSEIYRKYKIHSHLFNAQSHVLCGSILNKRYQILETSQISKNRLNVIKWDTKKDSTGTTKRSSSIVTEKENIEIQKTSDETVALGQNYSVSVNEFHSSESITPISASLFLFDSKKGLNEFSKVVGPQNDSDPGFKYEEINFFPSLYDIDRKINEYYNKQILLALDWMRKIHILEHAHRIESRQQKIFSEILSWGIVIVPAIISSLSLYLKQAPNGQSDFLIAFAILGGLSTLIGTLNKVMSPKNLSEVHRKNSENFEHLRHKIEKHIVFNNDERLEQVLNKVRKDWKKLTLHNVKERNFNKARQWIKEMNKYPENLGFIK